MACERYEILLVDLQGQAKQKREWTEAQLLGSVAWLKRMNARGHDVLIRPASQSGLVLLDRLTQADVSRLERSGVPCRAKVEAEPDRFQLWLKLGSATVSEKIAKALSEKFGLTKAEAGRFGMLGGFVKHQSDSRRDRDRFVLSHESTRPSIEAVAKWERMLDKAEKSQRALNLTFQDKSHGQPRTKSR